MKTILFIHQSAELYGSDKTLLYLVRELPKNNFRPIVVLPEKGPLSILLQQDNIQVIFNPVVKVTRAILSPKNIFLLPFQIVSALIKLKKSLAHEKIEFVHSNTLAVLAGAFYAKWMDLKHVWHIHEIIEHPKFIFKIYQFLVQNFSKEIIFNSKASLQSLSRNKPKIIAKSIVIYNGIESNPISYSVDEIRSFREKELKIPPHSLVLGVVGRISRWKGQKLLLDAFENLQTEFDNLYLLIIGSPPPGQEHFLIDLEQSIANKGLSEKVQLHPFTRDIWKFWSAIDIASVTSTEPEPFGLVAVEAMFSGIPVVAANHGGLTEIIEHEKTGILFEPGNSQALSNAIKLLINNNLKRNKIALAGKKYAKENFSSELYIRNFVDFYTKFSSNV
jgi:glycosyltransferase involved in cell wall biosynthesis